MTTRERFHKVLAGDPSVDRCPVFEWAIWWDKTLDEWMQSGMPKPKSDLALLDYFQLDHMAQFWFSHYTPVGPKPPATGSMIQTEADYERIRPYILPENAVELMMPKIKAIQAEHARGDTVVWYTVNGFFWFPRELFGDERNLYSFYDEPKLRHRICEDLVAWQIKIINQLGEILQADFMTIAEDMSYNLGPMISREMFTEFMLPYYKRLIPEVKKFGTKCFMDSDGDISSMIDWLIDAGVDGILPLERQAGVDLVRLRKQYPNFMFIGGFDKMCLFQGREAIRREVERLLPVIRSGHYIIGMDHQTPPGTTMENYRYYLSVLREFAPQACKDC
ncbi:MAG TPA: uroporphyrinogen decarboxylase family protein [Candidatus Limiplasma sp.]|nr:uroporphyrinogen decarboxylase family protein [Candidatus Limiplasma sp.]